MLASTLVFLRFFQRDMYSYRKRIVTYIINYSIIYPLIYAVASDICKQIHTLAIMRYWDHL